MASAAEQAGRARPLRGASVPVYIAPYELWIVQPLVVLALVYNLLQFVPQDVFPLALRGAIGYPSDLFLQLGTRTTVPTRILKSAMEPDGALGGSRRLALWRDLYGEAGLETLLWRLSSVDGRGRCWCPHDLTTETVFDARR